tara:strand:+ start:139 stop:285 length:147 start_codon:yes stop_codon:yes gene_type:complete
MLLVEVAALVHLEVEVALVVYFVQNIMSVGVSLIQQLLVVEELVKNVQ